MNVVCLLFPTLSLSAFLSEVLDTYYFLPSFPQHSSYGWVSDAEHTSEKSFQL